MNFRVSLNLVCFPFVPLTVHVPHQLALQIYINHILTLTLNNMYKIHEDIAA